MALAAATVFEVRTTGSDNNGGGFVTGASGTDFSQQTSAQFALTSLTTAAANAIILTASAATTMVGNLMNITGGTNFITGIYQITAVSAGVSITVDRNCTSAAGAAGTANVGGCFATIAKALASMTVTGMQTYIKATATYSISTGLSTPAGVTTAGICRIIGYTTTRGDGLPPTIQGTAAITLYTESRGNFRLENFILDGNAKTATTGAALSGNASYLFNCTMQNFSDAGANITGAGSGLIQCSVTGNGGGVNGAAIFSNQNGIVIRNCYINANTTAGISVIGNYGSITGNIISNNSGASSDGIILSNNYSSNRILISANVFYTNGRDGVRNTGVYNPTEISNNIFVSNVGIGLNTSSMTTVSSDVLLHHNAFYNNGTARSGNNAGTGDVTLTGVPFTNAGSADYSLNNTASQGAACRGVGYPGIFPGGLTTGYVDIGAVQHQDAGGSGAMIRSRVFTGM